MYKIFIIILASLCCIQSHACDCVVDNSVKRAYNKSDAVFEGVVISKSVFYTGDTSVLYKHEGARARYVFEIVTSYKGKHRKKEIEIITAFTEGACGYVFETGKKYIVYATYQSITTAKAQKSKRYLYTTICTRTAESNQAEIAQLLKIK